jgi:hypothetical protein
MLSQLEQIQRLYQAAHLMCEQKVVVCWGKQCTGDGEGGVVELGGFSDKL